MALVINSSRGKDKEKIVESMFNDKYLTNLTDRLMNMVEGFYLFLPVQFIKCCEKAYKENLLQTADFIIILSNQIKESEFQHTRRIK